MRPVRFVALSEDGQALVLADEVGRLLTLPIDDRVAAMMRTDRMAGHRASRRHCDDPPSLAPRDIQARIRSGESAEDVARIAGVPVDRVLRYAGPVLQERAMLAQHARRTRLKSSEKGATLAEVVDARLSQHGVEMDKVSWDAYRRDDGTWRVVATWPSGKTNATAVWELDKARQLVAAAGRHGALPVRVAGPGRPAPRPRGRRRPAPTTAGTSRSTRRRDRPAHPRPDPGRPRRPARLARASAGLPGPTGRAAPAGPAGRLGRVRGRDAARCRAAGPVAAPPSSTTSATAAIDVPAVPSLAVLRPRRTAADAAAGRERDRPVKRGPSWDDILFGAAPAAKDA